MIDLGLLVRRNLSFWETAMSNVYMNQNLKVRPYHIAKEDGKVFITFSGVRHVSEFALTSSNKEKELIHYSFLEARASSMRFVVEALEDRLNKMSTREVKIYRSIFDDPIISQEVFQYPSDINDPASFYVDVNGLKISSRVKKVPTGKEGGLSDNLFIYLRSFVIGPAHKTVLKYR